MVSYLTIINLITFIFVKAGYIRAKDLSYRVGRSMFRENTEWRPICTKVTRPVQFLQQRVDQT